MEEALSAPYQGWYDNPSERASDWIHALGNPLKILDDFESAPDGGAAFTNVWMRFWRTHSPQNSADEVGANGNLLQCHRVLSLLVKLPQSTLQKSIEGITSWLSRWAKLAVGFPECLLFCLRLWPFAVEATNAEHLGSENTESELDETRVEQNPEPRQSPDTLNNPARELVMVFLSACPNLEKNARPFDGDGELRRMRDVMVNTSGRAGLVAKIRMTESLSYFLRADPDWAHKYLIDSLKSDNQEAICLWQAVACSTRFEDVLQAIGRDMANMIIENTISRDSRQSFIFSLVFESLHAFLENRSPAVRIQQMIRSLDDEDRAYAADAIQRFVRDVSHNREKKDIQFSPDQIFRLAAMPFLKDVWPQERSLATPGVSRALADLPAKSKEAFTEAVNVIERFLVPFECCSLSDYGLFESDVLIIDSEEKVEACLRLLDCTIGTSENAVVPFDLSDALDHIRKIAPKLAKESIFRRLETLSRRG
jgi:hypothetical protein